MKKIFSITFTFSFLISFSQKITIPLTNLIIDKKTDSLYLKKLNYFNYDKDDYIVDTIIIKNNLITFQKREKKQNLYLISSSINLPITYLPLRKSPEMYNYMFCSNFYKYDNYLLITDKFNIDEFKFLKSFYVLFSKKSFDRKLYTKGGDYKSFTISKAEKIIEKSKKLFYKKIKKNQGKFSNDYKEYLKTEIELGSINQFLNWYEETNNSIIKKEFLELKKSYIHEKYYNKFLNKKWNVNSIQYFRTVERYVNYLENKRAGKMKIYNEKTKQMKEDRKKIINTTASNNVK